MAHSYMYQACKVALFPTSPQELLSLTCKSLFCNKNTIRSVVAFFELLLHDTAALISPVRGSKPSLCCPVQTLTLVSSVINLKEFGFSYDSGWSQDN